MAKPGAVSEVARNFLDNVERVIVGKRRVAELALVALLCEGHVLVEDVPGVGKTMLARTLARSLDCSFRRIQCTPDLLPSDVTGLNYFSQKAQEFIFRPGPVFAQVVLVDEINRATPRTQSALLEAMGERQVTIDGELHELPRPFLVIATQNPIELEGTFPLPEAQLDRFLMRLEVGYPDLEESRLMLRRFRHDDPLASLAPVLPSDELTRLQAACRRVRVSEPVETYVLDLVETSRKLEDVQLGASPRAALALARTGQALAAVRGREFVLPDDVKAVAPAVLGHRLIVSAQSRLRGKSRTAIVAELLERVDVPVEAPALVGGPDRD